MDSIKETSEKIYKQFLVDLNTLSDSALREKYTTKPPKVEEVQATSTMIDAAFNALPPDAYGTIGQGEMERVLEAALRAAPKPAEPIKDKEAYVESEHGFRGTQKQLVNALYECGTRNGYVASAICKTAADVIMSEAQATDRTHRHAIANAIKEPLAEFLCDTYDPDFNPYNGYSWPEHKNDDGYRGNSGYTKLQPSDVQARAREASERIINFVIGEVYRELNR